MWRLHALFALLLFASFTELWPRPASGWHACVLFHGNVAIFDLAMAHTRVIHASDRALRVICQYSDVLKNQTVMHMHACTHDLPCVRMSRSNLINTHSVQLDCPMPNMWCVSIATHPPCSAICPWVALQIAPCAWKSNHESLPYHAPF